MTIEENVPLGRLTTVGIGGPARHFARPQSVAELEDALRWAAAEGLDVYTVGLGSNLLIADEGVDGLALRLEGELAAAGVEGERLVAGGGAANAVCLHRTRAARARRLRVRLRDSGDGRRRRADERGRVRGRLEADPGAGARRHGRGSELADARRARPRVPAFSLEPGEVVARAEFRLVPKPPEEIKATVAELQARRKAAQPTNKRTFGSVFKNPEHELSAGRMLEACGLRGHRIGGAQISPRHANFIENAGEARAADALALMAEARRRALERFGVELEHEVRFFGDLELPPAGETL